MFGAATQDPLYDPVYDLEKLAKLGDVKGFNAKLNEAQSRGYSFSASQQKEIEIARETCFSNATFAFEIPLQTDAKEGELTKLEQGLKELALYCAQSGQTFDEQKATVLRKEAATVAIEKLLKQSAEQANNGGTQMRDQSVAEAQQCSAQYGVPFTAEQNAAIKATLELTRRVEIEKSQDRIIECAYSTAPANEKLEQISQVLKVIDGLVLEASLTRSAEELAAFNAKWAPKLQDSLVKEAESCAHKGGRSKPFDRSMASLLAFSQLTGIEIPAATVSSLSDLASTKSINDLLGAHQVLEKAEIAVTPKQFDQLEKQINEIIAASNASVRDTAFALNTQQQTTLNRSYLFSRHKAIEQFFAEAEKACAKGLWEPAEEALKKVDEAIQENDPRFKLPDGFETKRASSLEKIYTIKLGEVFKNLDTVTAQGKIPELEELTKDIQQLAQAYSKTLSDDQQQKLAQAAIEVRENSIKKLSALSIDTLDLETIEQHLRQIKGVIAEGKNLGADLKTSENVKRLLKLVE